MGLSDSKIKIFLPFFQKKAFLIFWKKETLKYSIYFGKRNFLISQEKLPKSKKPKFIIPLQKMLRVNFSKTTFG